MPKVELHWQFPRGLEPRTTVRRRKIPKAPRRPPSPQLHSLRASARATACWRRRTAVGSVPACQVGARCQRPEPEPSMEQQPGPGARLATMQSGEAPAGQWTACRIGLRRCRGRGPTGRTPRIPGGPPPAHRRGMARRGITRTARVLDRGALARATAPSGPPVLSAAGGAAYRPRRPRLSGPGASSTGLVATFLPAEGG